MELRDAMVKLGGVATWPELSPHCSRRALERALGEADLVRVSRGHYALQDADEAKAAAARVGGVVSHLSAAILHGWKVQFPPDRPQVTVPRWRRLGPGRRHELEIHWADLHDDDRVDGVTSKPRTVLDCSRTLPFPAGLSVADSAMRDGMGSALIKAEAEGSARTGRAAALRVANAADGRAANPFESVLRSICLGVPGLSVQPQYSIRGIGRVDLVDLHLSLVIEADSWEFHGTPKAFAKDVHRYTALVAEGWTVVRFTWAEVMFQPEWGAGGAHRAGDARTRPSSPCEGAETPAGRLSRDFG